MKHVTRFITLTGLLLAISLFAVVLLLYRSATATSTNVPSPARMSRHLSQVADLQPGSLVSAYLPLVSYDPCANIPAPLSPAGQLNTLSPLFQIDTSSYSTAWLVKLDLAATPTFTPLVYWTGALVQGNLTQRQLSENLQPNTTYYWRASYVCDMLSGRQGPFSVAISFTTSSGAGRLPAPTPIAPAHGATLTPTTSVTLDWTPVYGAVNYLVGVGPLQGTSYTYLVTETQVSVNGLSNGTTYQWWVQAWDEHGYGAASPAWQFKIAPLLAISAETGN